MSHIDQLEQIDRQQRLEESENPTSQQSQAFAQPIVEALDTSADKVATPLLDQEEIIDQEPPRINLTAVVCTAIVAVCATIILLAAHPWSRDRQDETADPAIEATADAAPQQQPADKAKPADAPAIGTNPAANQQAKPEAKEEPAKNEEPAKKEEPAQKEQAAASTLPIVKTTKTGTDNPYNSLRLIDASSRLLTKSEVGQMTKAELALARNAIFARHGYQFKNKELGEFFAKQKWFKPTDITMDNIPFAKTELDNIRLIKAFEEKK